MKPNDPRIARVKEVFEGERIRLAKLFGVDLSKISIIIKPYRGRHLGQAHIEKYTEPFSIVQINSNYFSQFDSYNHVVSETITHEIVHIVNTLKNGWGIQPHGIQWKRLMVQAGKSPDRVATSIRPHDNAKPTRVQAKCSCGKTIWLTKRTWKRRAVYSHKNCGRSLIDAKFISEE